MTKPVAWMLIDEINGDYMLERHPSGDYDWIPLYTHPANACKHGVDDGACKECYLEAQNPYKPITNAKIEPTVVSYTHPVKELTDEEMLECAEGAGCVFDYSYKGEVTFISKNAFKRFVEAILRKAKRND